MRDDVGDGCISKGARCGGETLSSRSSIYRSNIKLKESLEFNSSMLSKDRFLVDYWMVEGIDDPSNVFGAVGFPCK